MCEAILARFSQIKELSHTRSFDNGYYRISASVSSHRIKTRTEDGRVSIIYQAKKTFSARLQHRSFIETHDLDGWEVRGYGELPGKILNPAILQEFHDRRDEANLLFQSAIDEANLALAQLLADIEPFKPAKRRKKSPKRDPVKAL